MYPYAADLYQLRTSEEMQNHAYLAQESGTDVSEKCKLYLVQAIVCLCMLLCCLIHMKFYEINRFMVSKDCQLCITI